MENTLVDEFVEHRLCCCRHCHGSLQESGKRLYQYTPAEYERAALSHAEKRARMLKTSDKAVDIGEFPPVDGNWYISRKTPNPDCPECHGKGVSYTLLRDTRHLSAEAKAAFAGVRLTKGGVVLMYYDKGVRREVTGR